MASQIDFNLKLRECKIKSDIKLQGALEQKGV